MTGNRALSRKIRILSTFVLFISVLSVVLVFAAPTLGQAYIATKVIMPKGATVRGTFMNSSGQIAGYFYQDGSCCSAFFWSASSGMINLGSLGGGISAAFGINDDGLVTGWSLTATGVYHAFLWTQAGGTQDLGINVYDYLGGGINNSGQVVGTLLGQYATDTAFVWSQSTGTDDLGTINGGAYSFANAINNSGQVVGSASSGTCTVFGGVPFLWTAAAGMQSILACTAGTGTAVNNSGQVVGNYASGSGTGYEGFFWSPDGGMQDLGQATECCPVNGPSGINDSGQVVGTQTGPIAFLWSQAAGTQDLNNLVSKGTSVSYAGSINNAGQIAAWGASPYLLTPKMNTVFTSSTNPSYSGQPVTFTATVGSIAGPPPDGELVTFYNGVTEIGTGTTASGVATFTTSSLTVKTHTIKATYAGDATFTTSSGTVTQVVEKDATTTALVSSLNPSAYNQPVTFTASVSPQFRGTLTGRVTFYDGTTSLGYKDVSGGVAEFTTRKLTSGAHSITATYNGSTSFDGSSSAPLIQTVN